MAAPSSPLPRPHRSAAAAAGGAADSTRQAAGRARHSRTLAVLTRAGLACYGVVHLLVAWLALQIAFGHTADEGDQSGAFRLLARQPGGKFLLVVVVVGLAAMTIWQLLLAFVGHTEFQGRRRVLERVGSAARAVIYGFLAVSAAKVAAGSGGSAAGKQQNTTAGVLGMTGGRFLVGLGALVVLGFGVGLAVYGVLHKFEERLMTGRMSYATRRTAVALGTVGYLAKGVAFGIVGVLLLLAAVQFDPNKARGLDAALHATAGKPYGGVLLTLIALGFAAFGAYCFLQARYRKV